MRLPTILHPVFLALSWLLAVPALGQTTPVYEGDADAIEAILAQSRRFSEAYEHGDLDTLVGIYAEDGVAAPGGRDFIRGREALRRYWQLPAGRVVTHHRATPVELRVTGDHAYDWGYYEGTVEQEGETRPPFRGKYLIVWQRDDDGVWRMAHDMWNSLPSDD